MGQADTGSTRARYQNDFAELVTEYDTDSLNGPDMGGVEFDDNALDASREYRRRIGGGNLLSYVKCLEVNARRSKLVSHRSLSTSPNKSLTRYNKESHHA